jgi:hypothetical protein
MQLILILSSQGVVYIVIQDHCVPYFIRWTEQNELTLISQDQTATVFSTFTIPTF